MKLGSDVSIQKTRLVSFVRGGEENSVTVHVDQSQTHLIVHSASTVVSDLLPDIDRLVERLSDVALVASFLARQVPERGRLPDVGVTLQVDRPTVLDIEPGSIVWRVESVRLSSLKRAPPA